MCHSILTKELGIRLGWERLLLFLDKMGVEVSDEEWGRMFSKCIDAEWRKSDSGLSDVVCGKTAWSAKTIKNKRPFTHKHIRLITGRNSVDYSFDVRNVHTEDPNKVGEMILGIWNARYEKETEQFSDLRTVILIRDELLRDFSVMEIETTPFDPSKYEWDWNHKNNLEGYEIATGIKRFTWQPHGSQFTTLPEAPDNRLKIRLKRPPLVNRDFVLNEIKFDPSWIEIIE